MSKKKASFEKLKSEVIIHVMDLIDKGQKEYRKNATEKLHEFAKFYNVPLKRKASKLKLKLSLRNFILNEEGYIITIINLYNSLNN